MLHFTGTKQRSIRCLKSNLQPVVQSSFYLPPVGCDDAFHTIQAAFYGASRFDVIEVLSEAARPHQLGVDLVFAA